MTDRSWSSNTPISVPLKVKGARITADLGGLKFDNQWGMIYDPETPIYPWQDPSPITPETQA
jgi:hypothetical protein